MVGQARPAAMTWARTRRFRSRGLSHHAPARVALARRVCGMVGPELRLQLVGRPSPSICRHA